MDLTLLLVVTIIVIALTFDYVNGFHDAANSIATIVATRVLSPARAVAWAAFFNFIAAFGFGTAVAKTVGKGLVRQDVVNEHVILGGLVGAIIWDLITWYFGLPTSSSHALVGGYAGAAMARVAIEEGWRRTLTAMIPSGWTVTLLGIVVAPLMGMTIAIILTVIVTWICRNGNRNVLDRYFRRFQLFSAAIYSFAHGTNDAQKTMGIIAGVLFTHPSLRSLVTASDGSLFIPFWIVLMAHAAIGLGTLSGGWRIIHTMGSKITKLKPMGGFAAELAGAVALFASANLGIPVSTTHTITGAIVGVGSMRRLSAVRWNVAGRIVWAWVLTIPASSVVAAVLYYLLSFIQRLIG